MSSSIVKQKFAATKTFWLLIGMVFLSLLLRDLPLFNLLLSPFNQFETLLHEASHALACVLTGGTVSGLTIVEDGNGHGGLTFTHGGIPFIYSQAGYMGEALWGCLLIALSRFPRISRVILILIGICLAAVSIWFMPGGLFTPVNGMPTMWVQTAFSMLWGLSMSAALIWIGSKFSDYWAHLALTFLAVQSCLSSLQGAWVLLLQSMGFYGGWSDATNMAAMTHTPPVIWGLWWAAFSLGSMSLTMWMTYKADKAVGPELALTSSATSRPAIQETRKAEDIEIELRQLHRDIERR